MKTLIGSCTTLSQLIIGVIFGGLLNGSQAQAQVAYETIRLPGVVVTGIRAEGPAKVLITASYTSGGTTRGGLYQGTLQSVLSAPASKWTFLTPVFPGQTVTSSTFYGPNTDFFNPTLGCMNIRAVGSYKYTTGASGPGLDHGMMYQGPITSGHWTQLDATSLVLTGESLLNTICHSTMGDLVVGNYDTSLATGKAFVFNVKTGKWVNFNPTGSKSVTAYGIWQNGGGASHSYTIAGGFSDVNSDGLDEGYIVDYNSVSGTLTNLKKLNYQNKPISSLISHFDGITGTDDGYNLTGDYVTVQPLLPGVISPNANPSPAEAGFFASVKRLKNGSIGEPVWKEIAFTSRSGMVATVTSGNTVVGNNVLGIYVDGSSSSYLATVYDNTPLGWLQFKLWDAHSILIYWLIHMIRIVTPVPV
jgi:hypothetical protein